VDLPCHSKGDILSITLKQKKQQKEFVLLLFKFVFDQII
jgi:hypothetical protein